MPFTIITGSSFTSTGVGVKLLMPSSPDYVETWNITQSAASNPNTVIRGQWFGSKFGAGASAPGLGLQTVKTTFDLTSQFAAGTGFTFVSSSPVVEAQSANAITAITAANPAVVSQTNTYSNGDLLQFYSTTGMLQMGGLTAQISSVSGSGYTLLGLPATASNGFASAATAGFTRRVSQFNAVDPEYLYITNISQATSAVVSFSVDPANYYVVGMKMYFSVPFSFGMTQINGLTGTITAVNAVAASSNIGAYNVTVNIDSSAFSAFAWPASTASPTAALFATVAPSGSSTTFNPRTNVTTGYNFPIQAFRTGQIVPFLFLAGGAQSPAGANNDIINWAAYKFEN
jgi:hypothetical protein